MADKPTPGLPTPGLPDPDVGTDFPFPTFHSNAKEHPVLWDFDHYNELMELPLPVIRTGTQNMGNGVYWLKAGTPLSAEGAVANTSDAVCVVAEDFYFYENKPNQAKLVKVIVKGYVDLAEAEARSGLTYTEDALSALETAGVVMVDGKLAASGGGGGGLPSYTNDDIGKSLKLVDSGEITTGTVIAIPEQTIMTHGDEVGGSIQISAYNWIVGETIHLVIDGESQDCVVEPILGGHKITASLSGGLSMMITDVGDVYGPSGETYTISATKEGPVPVATPAWVPGGSSGGGVLVVHATENEAGTALVLDKTWQEIHDGVESSGCAVIFWPPDNGLDLSYVYGLRRIPGQTPGTYNYSVAAMDGFGLQMNVSTYMTNSADGYPEKQLGG